MVHILSVDADNQPPKHAFTLQQNIHIFIEALDSQAFPGICNDCCTKGIISEPEKEAIMAVPLLEGKERLLLLLADKTTNDYEQFLVVYEDILHGYWY